MRSIKFMGWCALAAFVAGCMPNDNNQPEPTHLEERVGESEQANTVCVGPSVPMAGAPCAIDDDCVDDASCTTAACVYGVCEVVDHAKGYPCSVPGVDDIGSCGGDGSGRCCDDQPAPPFRCMGGWDVPSGCTTNADCWNGSSCVALECQGNQCVKVNVEPENTRCRLTDDLWGACNSDGTCCVP